MVLKKKRGCRNRRNSRLPLELQDDLEIFVEISTLYQNPRYKSSSLRSLLDIQKKASLYHKLYSAPAKQHLNKLCTAFFACRQAGTQTYLNACLVNIVTCSLKRFYVPKLLYVVSRVDIQVRLCKLLNDEFSLRFGRKALRVSYAFGGRK